MNKLKLLFGNAALFFVALLVAFVIGELLVRQFAPQKLYRFPPGMFAQLDDGGYSLTPNFDGSADTIEYKTVISTNSLGLRASEEYAQGPNEKKRVLVIGDSFTMGVGVNVGDTFVQQLENLLNAQSTGAQYELINAGVPGYDTPSALNLLRRLLPKLKPDLVLLAYYVGNDVIDNRSGIPTSVVDGYLSNPSADPGILPKPLRTYLRTSSHLYQLIWPIQRRLRDPEFGDQMESDTRHILSIYKTRESSKRKRMWESTRQHLEKFAAMATTGEFRTGLIIIPEHIQIDGRLWETILELLPRGGKGYERSFPNERILGYGIELGLPSIDLFPAFTKRENSSLYFPLDGHWTIEGNALAARELVGFVQVQSAGVPLEQKLSETSP